MTYGYTAAGRLDTAQSPMGDLVTAYAYDSHGRVSQVNVNGATVVAGIGYQAFGGF